MTRGRRRPVSDDDDRGDDEKRPPAHAVASSTPAHPRWRSCNVPAHELRPARRRRGPRVGRGAAHRAGASRRCRRGSTRSSSSTTRAPTARPKPRCALARRPRRGRAPRRVTAASARPSRRATARARRVPAPPRDAFVVMAGDGQMDPRDLPALVASGRARRGRLRQGQPLRAPRHRRARCRAARRLGGLVFSWATARAIGMPISDSQCGYTAIARDACARLDLDALWPRYGYPNDLLVAARPSRRFASPRSRFEPCTPTR